MRAANYDDVCGQLVSAGLILGPEGILIDTPNVVRCKVEGRSQKPGWYRLFEVGDGSSSVIFGAYGINQGGDHGTQKIVLRKDDRLILTADQHEAMRARQNAIRLAGEAALREQYEKASRKSSVWWRKCLQSGESAYLMRKGLPPGKLYGARLSPSGNLVIPLQDHTGKIFGLQVIYHDSEIVARKRRDKDFTPAGLAKKGHWFVIGGLAVGAVALICEGFATGASLHEATGLPVVVAFDANNLLPVAQEIARRYRGCKLLFCADDDYDWQQIGKPNAGMLAANTAALAVDGRVVFPIFPTDRPVLTHKGPTDFNDLHTHPSGSLAMVRAQVHAALSAAGWGVARRVSNRVPESEQGRGDALRAPMRGLYTLEEACDRWTLLYGADGAFFDSVEHMIVSKSDVLALIPDHAARDWKLRPDRKVARFKEVGFDPTERDPDVVCNLWGGWPTRPKAGDCEPLLDLLRFLCSLETNAQTAYEWALRWLAFPIQHQGAKLKTTLVFHGMQGAGKNLFFDVVASLYGEYGGTVDQLAVESQFNDWASRKLFLVFDEVVARNELYFLKNRIKSLITGDTIRINPKNLSAWTERNHCNGVWLSNELHPTAVELFDRRHFIIWTPPVLSQECYREVAACIANGGREALHDYLLNLDLGDFDEHTKPPMTDAKLRVQELSSGSVERFFKAWISRELDVPVCPCGSGHLYRAYSRFSVSGGEKPRSHIHLSGYIAAQPGWELRKKDIFETVHYGGKIKQARMVIPPDQLLHGHGSEDYRKRANQTESQWATDGYFSFADALKDDK